MSGLFLYNDGRRGEIVLCRAIHRAVAKTGIPATVGVCKGDAELVADVCGPTLRVVESPFVNTVHGSPLPLASIAPPGTVPLRIWLGGNEEVPNYQWPDVVDGFHRQLDALGIPVRIADPEGPVPMFDFEAPLVVPTPKRPAVWIDNQRTTHDACWFVFDLDRLARVLPDHDLLCTGPITASAPNLVDVSSLPWPVRSRLSECCEALVGCTMDPFVVTMTEANRWKPKALCGYDARVHAPFWDYPGNPMELLGTMDELVDFLIANVREVVHR